MQNGYQNGNYNSQYMGNNMNGIKSNDFEHISILYKVQE